MPSLGSFAALLIGFVLIEISMHLTMPPAAWIGLLLILHGSRSLSPIAGMVSIFALGTIVLAVGERSAIPAAGVGYAVAIASMTVTFGLPFLADRWLASRFISVHVASTLIFPAAFVAVEFLRSRALPNATWGSIAYTQYGVLPLMQVAAAAGIWGITFLMAWSVSTAEVAWRAGFDWSVVRVPVLACATVCAAAFAAGIVRVAVAATDRAAMRVAALNRPIDLFAPGEMTRITEGRVAPAERAAIDAKLAALHAWFLDGSRREAHAGARLVVWPEQNLLVFKEDEAPFLARAQRLAAEERIYLAMGMGTIHLGDALPFENKLVLVNPSGRIVLSYVKSHPVPGWEASIMRRGDGRLPVVETPEGRIAAAICYDGSFPEFIRQAAAGSADVLILPVNDWKAVKGAHFQMHAFRAIEAGVPIVRAAASGISGVFDPWGRVLGVSDFFAPGDRTLIAQLPLGSVRTLYAQTGDLFAWLCVAGAAAALAIELAR